MNTNNGNSPYRCIKTVSQEKSCNRKRERKRKKIVSLKKLGFNCLKYGQREADLPSCTCFKYNQKHHTSLYINNQLQDNSSNKDHKTKEKMIDSFKEKNFTTLSLLSTQMEFSIEPQWILVLEVARPQQLWSIDSVQVLSDEKQDKHRYCYHYVKKNWGTQSHHQ